MSVNKRMNMIGRGKTAIITGATGGLGKAFSHRLAAAGYNLLLSGRQTIRLHEQAGILQAEYGVHVETLAADLSCTEGIQTLAEKVKALPRVDMLVSNAGYGEGALFENETVEDVLKMIRVHIDATVQLVHAVLPAMRRQQAGDIIAVSSLSAFVPAPGSSIYASTKTFLNTFMESVQMEVRRYNIRVQSLCPGLTYTGFHNLPIKNTGVLWMQPDDVVRYALHYLGDGRVVYIPGMKNKLIRWATALLPRRSYLILTERLTGKLRLAGIQPAAIIQGG